MLISCASDDWKIAKVLAKNGETISERDYFGYSKTDLREAVFKVLRTHKWVIVNDKDPIVAKVKGNGFWFENFYVGLEHPGFIVLHGEYRKSSSHKKTYYDESGKLYLIFTINISDNTILIDSKGSTCKGIPITPTAVISHYLNLFEQTVKPVPVFMKNQKVM